MTAVSVGARGFGLHLPSMLTAWSDPQSLTEYVSAPTPFWLVKLMDLGIVVPVALATAVGLRRGASWAGRTLYPLLAGYACLAISVTAMGVVMLARNDPDASLAVTAGFAGFALALIGLVLALYRPLALRDRRRTEDPTWGERSLGLSVMGSWAAVVGVGVNVVLLTLVALAPERAGLW
jgi:hypothetical protein